MRFCIKVENSPGAARFGFTSLQAMQFRIKPND
jgi:hypothetical protein